MYNNLIETGKIVNTHGVRGEVKIQPWCDAPELFLELDELYLDGGGTRLEIELCRIHQGNAIVKLKGVDSRQEAEAYKNKIVFLDRDSLELEEGVYFVQDLLGLAVTDADSGEAYGVITDIAATGANDVYELTAPHGNKKYIPAIKDVVIEVDIEKRGMKIRPLKGLF